MKRIATVYDMMISSPSDTKEEVSAVFESIMDFNRGSANQKGPSTMVRILKWNTDVFMNSNKKPQESINEQIVAACDFAVVIFRRRLGTPVGRDKSGTAQELRLLRKNKKQIFVFYLSETVTVNYPKEATLEERKEFAEQELALHTYITKLKKEGIPINTYIDTADLRKQLLDQLNGFYLLKNAPDLQAVDSLGICSIAIGGAEHHILSEKIENAKHIKVFATTGCTLFHIYVGQFSKMLRNNGTLQVLLPNPESDFLRDVDLLENRDGNPISREFDATISNLRKVWLEANRTPCDTLGKIQLGCAHTMLRQTEIICIDKENENDDDDKQIWCWVTMTMPPFRAGADSPSLECYTTKSAKSTDLSLAGMTNHSFNRSWEESKFKIEFDGEQIDEEQKIRYFYMEKSHAVSFWEKKLNAAKECALQARTDSKRNGVLIEVAAQHPLETDGTPGIEFARRLDMGYKLYGEYQEKNIRCKLYVPGSLHMYNGVEDKVPLSEAGRKYLIDKGVSPEDIYGEDQNVKYRGTDGVYNSADECFVASQIWKNERFSELICVCSPIQSMRKTAHYIAFGVFPSVLTCPSPELFHDYVYEMFTALPYVLYEDFDLDPKKSKLAREHRVNRKPGFANAQGNAE